MIKRLAIGLLSICQLTSVVSAEVPVPPHGKAMAIFDGRNPGNFDTFLLNHGLNNDPAHVFQFERGDLHISGQEFGYIITKQEYENYYLRAEFKWGEGTYAPREGKARDSGILYHIRGPNKVWPTSLEFQIQEGNTGDIWLTAGGKLTTTNGTRLETASDGGWKIDRIDKGPWQDVAGYRDPLNEVEKPHGEWNVLELIAQNGHVQQYVNGKLANEGSEAFPHSGKILLQSEGAEVFFRNVDLFPLTK